MNFSKNTTRAWWSFSANARNERADAIKARSAWCHTCFGWLHFNWFVNVFGFTAEVSFARYPWAQEVEPRASKPGPRDLPHNVVDLVARRRKAA